MRLSLACLSALLSLTGCAEPRVITRTVRVEVPVPVYMPVDPALLQPTLGPSVPARPLFCDDLERLAHQRQAALDRCNADKAATLKGSGPEAAAKANAERRP